MTRSRTTTRVTEFSRSVWRRHVTSRRDGRSEKLETPHYLGVKRLLSVHLRHPRTLRPMTRFALSRPPRHGPAMRADAQDRESQQIALTALHEQ
jgi:hypothetical protein